MYIILLSKYTQSDTIDLARNSGHREIFFLSYFGFFFFFIEPHYTNVGRWISQFSHVTPEKQRVLQYIRFVLVYITHHLIYTDFLNATNKCNNYTKVPDCFGYTLYILVTF